MVGDGEPCDPDHVASLLIDAEPGVLIEALVSVPLETSANGEWIQSWADAEGLAMDALEPAIAQGHWEGGIALTIVNSLPDGAVLHVGNSMPIRDLDAFAPPTGRRIRVFANRGMNGIDGVLSTAAGEAAGDPESPMALLVGDLSFLHDLSGLSAIAGARLTVVVVDNGGGGIFEFLPISKNAEVFETGFLTPQAMAIDALCAAAGLRYERITNTEELGLTLSGELEREGAAILHVVVDRRENIERHEAAWAAVTAKVEALS
jgi:2-succinyl-5-enolpyruvyl-6-hydroxy-3-cyclohexene-1-carboxylate synthase